MDLDPSSVSPPPRPNWKQIDNGPKRGVEFSFNNIPICLWNLKENKKILQIPHKFSVTLKIRQPRGEEKSKTNENKTHHVI